MSSELKVIDRLHWASQLAVTLKSGRRRLSVFCHSRESGPLAQMRNPEGVFSLRVRACPDRTPAVGRVPSPLDEKPDTRYLRIPEDSGRQPSSAARLYWASQLAVTLKSGRQPSSFCPSRESRFDPADGNPEGVFSLRVRACPDRTPAVGRQLVCRRQAWGDELPTYSQNHIERRPDHATA